MALWWLWLACGGGPPPIDGVVLAVAESDEGHSMVRIDLRSGQATPLSATEGRDFPAAPDPRGTHALIVAAFDEGEAHREQLLLLPLIGGDPLLLGPPAEAIRNPAWSPDGAFIVFESSAASFRDLYRIERDGSGLVRLTDTPSGSFDPSVSPSGQHIAFASSRDGNAEIYVMAADGSAQRRLTDHPQDDTKPRWVSDDQLLWIRQIATRRTVWRVGADGAHPHPIRGADDRLIDHDLVVSPDGQRVAVITQTDAKKIDLVVVDLTTKREVSLGGEGVDEMPSWSPDGKWLVWSSTRSGDPELWIGSADGAHTRPLTERPGADWLPRWVGGR